MSCLLARPNSYLPVIDGPRMGRPDHDAEAVRRNNGIARCKARNVVLAGLPDEAEAALAPYLKKLNTLRVRSEADVTALARELGHNNSRLTWGREHIGLGLLTALRAGSLIEFTDAQSPTTPIPSKSKHLVVCESGEELSEVIAANYAFSLGAGLVLIPPQAKHITRGILERFYSLNDPSDKSPTEQLKDLSHELRELCGDLPLEQGYSITFVTDGLPYGFAYPAAPSTHLFKYPDLGLTIINGFASEQPGTRGVNVALLIDPLQTDAPEIDAASELLAKRGMLVRGQRGAGAKVHKVSQLIELFPYDLLILATHCGDADGYRWTYKFTDSDGRERTLVVDIAIGIGDPGRGDDMLEVMEFARFHALDGVLWDDPDRLEKVDVGSAIKDYSDRRRDPDFQPISKELIPRVSESVALKMFDYNYLAMPRSLAGHQLPVVVNNACASWRELADRFIFANARAYVGTLFPIATTDAHDVIIGALDKYYEKPLAHSLWSAQNRVYGDGVRRPYIVTGVYPQRLRITTEDMISRIHDLLARDLAHWRKRALQPIPEGVSQRAIEEIVRFYEHELQEFERLWSGDLARSASGAP